MTRNQEPLSAQADLDETNPCWTLGGMNPIQSVTASRLVLLEYCTYDFKATAVLSE